MGSISIVHDEPAFVTCASCNGRGYTTALRWGIAPDWCPECEGAKEVAVDLSSLATLAHNLAIAGGLCAAFEQGWAYGAWWEAAHPGDEPEFQPGHSIPRGTGEG
jgi:hypothetical protein